ncbi:MAG: alpha/beta hydrolase [SAR324 cluster bacterium]|nr:alpha/beta hydrolase [SAR324 cluster bacterium]
MPYVTSHGVQLYFEEAGSGEPILFIHEFADDLRSWELQMSYFSRRYRCIAYNARGYPPSDIPEKQQEYSQNLATDDIANVLKGLGLKKAHVVGLSMGSFAALHFGIRYPEMAFSITVAGTGYGALSENHEQLQQEARTRADLLENEGFGENGGTYALTPPRLTFKKKDPRGWLAFAKRLSEHSALGSAQTLRGVQAQRPGFAEMEKDLKKFAVPLLLIAGDEDDPSLEATLFLKKTVPSAALWVFPKTGHSMNLEEPDLFNKALQDFISAVSANRWEIRDLRNQSNKML